jgi:hypothetical protein
MATGNVQDREASIAQLFRELSQETAGLVREELRLAREDLTQHVQRVGGSAGLLGGAGLLGVGAFGALTAALIAALGRGRPGRGAFLVASLYGAGAAALAMAGRKGLAKAAPEAVEAIQRDVKAAAEGTRDAG